MLKFDHIDPDYSDFIYRLEDFYKIFEDSIRLLKMHHFLLTKKDALILYSIVRGVAPKNTLEIGRCFGTSTMVICGALSDNGHGHLDSVDILDAFEPKVRNLTTGFLTEYIFDSKEVTERLEKKYQLFFIDGDHSLEYQIIDIESSICLSDDNSWLILHDANLKETIDAVKYCCEKYNSLIDFGRLGDQLYILKIKK